jgi:uncharacterized protein (DUF486 family)
VSEVFITMSGFAEATLATFRLPFVSVVDADTSVPLCEYHLEVKSNRICPALPRSNCCHKVHKRAGADCLAQSEIA